MWTNLCPVNQLNINHLQIKWNYQWFIIFMSSYSYTSLKFPFLKMVSLWINILTIVICDVYTNQFQLCPVWETPSYCGKSNRKGQGHRRYMYDGTECPDSMRYSSYQFWMMGSVALVSIFLSSPVFGICPFNSVTCISTCGIQLGYVQAMSVYIIIV